MLLPSHILRGRSIPAAVYLLPVSSEGSWGLISCSSTSNVVGASGGVGSSGGAAFTGVVDSGVSKASSESELLNKIQKKKDYLKKRYKKADQTNSSFKMQSFAIWEGQTFLKAF